LQYQYDGNQATQITDDATAEGFPVGSTSYTYDANRNTTQDGANAITYNGCDVNLM